MPPQRRTDTRAELIEALTGPPANPRPPREAGASAFGVTLAIVTSLTVVIAGSAVLSRAASAAEEVSNGTFETSTSGWLATPKDDGSAPVALARVAGGHTGSYAARVSNTSTATATTVLNDSPNSVPSTTAGQTYRATAWLRASQANTSLVLRLLEFDTSNVLRASKQSSYWATDTLWHKITVDLVASRSGASIDVNALAWDLGPGKSFLVDDVSVAPLTTTTARLLPARPLPPRRPGCCRRRAPARCSATTSQAARTPAPWRARSGASST